MLFHDMESKPHRCIKCRFMSWCLIASFTNYTHRPFWKCHSIESASGFSFVSILIKPVILVQVNRLIHSQSWTNHEFTHLQISILTSDGATKKRQRIKNSSKTLIHSGFCERSFCRKTRKVFVFRRTFPRIMQGIGTFHRQVLRKREKVTPQSAFNPKCFAD